MTKFVILYLVYNESKNKKEISFLDYFGACGQDLSNKINCNNNNETTIITKLKK